MCDEFDYISHITDDMSELKELEICDVNIYKQIINGAYVNIKLNAITLTQFLTIEQLQAINMTEDPIYISVNASENTLKVIGISQNNKPNVIEGNLMNAINTSLKSHNKTYENHRILYDVCVLKTLRELGNIGLCVYALDKFNGRIDDVYVYILEHEEASHDALEIISKHNHLAFIVKVFMQEIPTICERCLICYSPLDYVCIKPTICESKLCQMQYCELGVGFSIENEILNNPKVLDLLVSVFVTYVSTSVDERFDMTFFNSYNINLDTMKKCVELIPSVSTMQNMITSGVFKENLNKINTFIIPLLKWIITSNRAYLKVCDKTDIIQLKSCSGQIKEVFMMKTDTIARERVFNDYKILKGVTYLYHGSAFQNWHLILKMGLKNYSNSKYMACGAAYGSGIYLATQIETSRGYCRSSNCWNKSEYKNSTLLALCEVANVPELLNKGGSIYTLTNEDALVTRYLLVL